MSNRRGARQCRSCSAQGCHQQYVVTVRRCAPDGADILRGIGVLGDRGGWFEAKLVSERGGILVAGQNEEDCESGERKESEKQDIAEIPHPGYFYFLGMIGGVQDACGQMSALGSEHIVIFAQVLFKESEAWILLSQVLDTLSQNRRSCPPDFL
jgi:hypothetical protein